jgi:hypothetical protein
MREKKMELELSIISDETNYKHQILDRAFIDRLTATA